MQISYLYASDFPARQTSRNKKQTDPKQFLVSIVLIVLRKAQINRRDQSEEDVTKTGNGEWGMGNGEWGMGNGEWGMGNGNGEWEIENGKLIFF